MQLVKTVACRRREEGFERVKKDVEEEIRSKGVHKER